MARIELKNLAHSYLAKPKSPADFALRAMDMCWQDGGAYALLGPSGCGKTTLLNILSGLLRPSDGDILFDGQRVTDLPTEQRHIAQVFQFPVVYETMSVFENLAFPLRNRAVAKTEIKRRVDELADMLGLAEVLSARAKSLSAENKQKVSLARGLIRDDVNAILFDEPLTVIDPEQKWHLRLQLKQLHKRFGFTMIYVTHDQTEALSFADQVVVMNAGEILQVGTPEALYARPEHAFVGYFIGSPGMNFVDCQYQDNRAMVGGHSFEVRAAIVKGGRNRLQLGIRPEFLSLTRDSGVPANVISVANNGRHQLVKLAIGNDQVTALVARDIEIPADQVRVCFDPAHSLIYADGQLVSQR